MGMDTIPVAGCIHIPYLLRLIKNGSLFGGPSLFSGIFFSPISHQIHPSIRLRPPMDGGMEGWTRVSVGCPIPESNGNRARQSNKKMMKKQTKSNIIGIKQNKKKKKKKEKRKKKKEKTQKKTNADRKMATVNSGGHRRYRTLQRC